MEIGGRRSCARRGERDEWAADVDISLKEGVAVLGAAGAREAGKFDIIERHRFFSRVVKEKPTEPVQRSTTERDNIWRGENPRATPVVTWPIFLGRLYRPLTSPLEPGPTGFFTRFLMLCTPYRLSL